MKAELVNKGRRVEKKAGDFPIKTFTYLDCCTLQKCPLVGRLVSCGQEEVSSVFDFDGIDSL